MKWHSAIAILLSLCCGVVIANEVAVSVSTSCAYALNTTGSPYAAATAAEIDALPPVAYHAGETVAVTNPNGSVAMLVESAPAAGVHLWSPSAGGVYSFVNDAEGSAAVNVYYSAFGFNGSGTVGDPSHVIDSADFAATLALASNVDGFTFVLDGSAATLDGFAIPAGYAAVELGNGVWQLIAVEDGLVAASSAFIYTLETERGGPDRKGKKSGVWPAIAYTGDGWVRDESAPSTLTIEPPAGAASVTAKAGTGAVPFSPNMAGEWMVTLEYGTTVLVSRIMVTAEGTFIIVR